MIRAPLVLSATPLHPPQTHLYRIEKLSQKGMWGETTKTVLCLFSHCPFKLVQWGFPTTFLITFFRKNLPVTLSHNLNMNFFYFSNGLGRAKVGGFFLLCLMFLLLPGLAGPLDRIVWTFTVEAGGRLGGKRG